MQTGFRNAFTIVELLVVLGLIVAILSLGLPRLHRTYAHNQLRSTVQEVQGELYRTRLDAMKAGKAYVFRYGYGSSIYEILPKEVYDRREKSNLGLGAAAIGGESFSDPDRPLSISGDHSVGDHAAIDDSSEDDLLGGDTVGGWDEGRGMATKTGVYERSLPSRIVFGEATGMSPAWSTPILFYPNGRTSQASIVLRTTDRYEFRQELILRGLTGTARISGE